MQRLCSVSIVKRGATVITQFWVTPKFCFPFLKKKKKPARCRFERHCAASSPLQMQRQGRIRFLKTFPANFSFSLLPLAHKTWTQATSHTLPPLMQAMTGHLTRCHGSGKVPLSSCGYKYREGRRQRRGGEKRKKRKRRGEMIF